MLEDTPALTVWPKAILPNNTHKRGIFIVFEGLDGSGKTTQCNQLSAALTERNIEYITTREPTGSRVGLLLREALKKNLPLEAETIALLFAADRYQHAVTEILPALREGKHVICDRYYYSSLAYQKKHNAEIYNKRVLSECRPDITFFIDVPPPECMNRIKNRGGAELFDSLEELERVREAYIETFEGLRETDKVVIIDGNGLRPEEVAEKVWRSLK
jgi:dTMP kinase